jgi:hypothetical protein
MHRRPDTPICLTFGPTDKVFSRPYVAVMRAWCRLSGHTTYTLARLMATAGLGAIIVVNLLAIVDTGDSDKAIDLIFSAWFVWMLVGLLRQAADYERVFGAIAPDTSDAIDPRLPLMLAKAKSSRMTWLGLSVVLGALTAAGGGSIIGIPLSMLPPLLLAGAWYCLTTVSKPGRKVSERIRDLAAITKLVPARPLNARSAYGAAADHQVARNIV